MSQLTSISPAPTAPAVIPHVPLTREDVTAKLLHHLELALGSSFKGADKLPHTPTFLANFITCHFRLSYSAAKDAVAASDSLAELSSRISDLLFQTPRLF